MDIIIDHFTPHRANTLKGFITVVLTDEKSGFEMAIFGFTYHEKNGDRWIELPARPPTNPEKNKSWVKVCVFYDKRKEIKFKKTLLDKLDKYFNNSTTS